MLVSLITVIYVKIGSPSGKSKTQNLLLFDTLGLDKLCHAPKCGNSRATHVLTHSIPTCVCHSHIQVVIQLRDK